MSGINSSIMYITGYANSLFQKVKITDLSLTPIKNKGIIIPKAINVIFNRYIGHWCAIIVGLITIAGWIVQSKVKFLRNKPKLVFAIIFFGILMFLEYVVFD